MFGFPTNSAASLWMWSKPMIRPSSSSPRRSVRCFVRARRCRRHCPRPAHGPIETLFDHPSQPRPPCARLCFMRLLVLLSLVLVLIGTARAGDADAAFRNGLNAFNEGTYARARAAWGPLAEAGDARAQAGLGYMYYSGRGVAR